MPIHPPAFEWYPKASLTILHQLAWDCNEIVTSRLNNSYSFVLANDYSVVISIAVFPLLYIARPCGWRKQPGNKAINLHSHCMAPA